MAETDWTDDIPPVYLVQFFESIPSRLPPVGGEVAQERRATIGRELSILNAQTLGRSPDLRIRPDVESLSAQLARRLDHYGSDDWDRLVDGVPLIDVVRRSVGVISTELRAGGGLTDDDDDWGDS